MCDYKRITDQIRQGAWQEGMTQLYECGELRKVAAYVHQQHGWGSSARTWEDLFTEAVIRTVEEIRSGRGPRWNFRSYFKGLCFNLCVKWGKEDTRLTEVFELLAYLVALPEHTVSYDKVVERLHQIGRRCQSLLWLYYFADPPVHAREDLSAALAKEGYNIKPDVMPVVLAQCRRKFGDLLGGGPGDQLYT
jgi:hypothetical protein